MAITILMSGDNLHGRLMVDEILRAGIVPDLIINEMGTARAEKLGSWLSQARAETPSVIDRSKNYKEVDAFNGDQSLDAIKEYGTKYLIIAGCGAIIKNNILSLAIPLNIHPGLLPYFRGLDPVLWSIEKHKPVGATVHIMDEGIDTGDILISRALPKEKILNSKTITQLRVECMRWGGTLLAEFLLNPAAYNPQKQNEQDACYFSAYPENQKPELEKKLIEYQHDL